MIVYLDASALVKRYVRETGSEQVEGWIARLACVTSRFSGVEIASALARRAREGGLDPAERDRLLRNLRTDMQGLYVVETEPPVMRLASDLVVRHPLRAGDAIHLASAVHVRDLVGDVMAFLAFDRRLTAAAAAEEFDVEPP